MTDVIIFRHQLFKVSEPFITQQAEQLKHFSPIYVGRNRFGPAPEGAKHFALEDLPEWGKFYRQLWQVLSRDPKLYIKLLTEQKPKLIHAHFGVEGLYALPLAHKLDIPLVTTFHGFDATTSIPALLRSRSPSWINYALFRHQLAKNGDLFICVSEYIRQKVIQLGFPEQRTCVHYMGIDTQAIQPRDPLLETRMLLHVARLVEKKGTEYLIRAFSAVAQKDKDVQLIIIGDGPLKLKLIQLSDSLGLTERIQFLGAQPHLVVLQMMQRAAALVLPSVTAESGDAEGLGMVLLEAAATGVPVIGTLHGGIPEAIVDGETGYLVPERDVYSLTERIVYLLENDTKRQQMGKRCRMLMESKFEVQKQTILLEKIYKETL